MKKLFSLRGIGILVLVLIGIVLIGLFSQVENWKRDLSINHASLDPESTDASLHPPVVAESVEEVARRIVQFAENGSLWSVESKDLDQDPATIHLTRTTRIFRWVDDIHVRLTKVDDGVRVNAESQSRVGKGDLGQNPRNLRELVAAIR